jgi:hypothetical protein
MAYYHDVYAKVMGEALGLGGKKDIDDDEQGRLPRNYAKMSHLAPSLYGGLSSPMMSPKQLRHFCACVCWMVFPCTDLATMYQTLHHKATDDHPWWELPEEDYPAMELEE